MKAFLHLLQGDGQKTLPGNGIIQQDSSTQSVLHDSVSVDVNGRVQEELAGPPVSNHNGSANLDLNSKVLGNFSAISDDDLRKIQVGYCV